MARRRSGQPAISLFSFQDIVTSVTAILILLVLIMTLELISRKCREAAGSVSHVRDSLATQVQDLEAVEARLQRLLPESNPAGMLPTRATLENDERLLRQQVEAAEERRDEAQQIHIAAAELLAEATADLREAKRSAADREEELAAEAAATEDRLRATERETASLEGRAAGMERKAEETRQSNTQQRDRVDERERQVDELPRSGTELVFRRPANLERQPWLLELSADGLAALRLGTGEVLRLGKEGGPGSAFNRWVAGLAAGDDYVLILVRPSGVRLADDARQALVARHITVGLDFIGEDQGVHDAARARDEGDETASEEAR
jgi:hypothetical protein